jgi:hypothetical protein
MAYRFQVAGLWLIFRGVIHTSVGESPRRCLLVLIKFHHLSLFDGPSTRSRARLVNLLSCSLEGHDFGRDMAVFGQVLSCCVVSWWWLSSD